MPLLLAAGWAGGSARADDLLTPAERAWLVANPRLVLGASDDWGPWVIKDSRGRVSGFAVDHLELLNCCRRPKIDPLVRGLPT